MNCLYLTNLKKIKEEVAQIKALLSQLAASVTYMYRPLT